MIPYMAKALPRLSHASIPVHFQGWCVWQPDVHSPEVQPDVLTCSTAQEDVEAVQCHWFHFNKST